MPALLSRTHQVFLRGLKRGLKRDRGTSLVSMEQRMYGSGAGKLLTQCCSIGHSARRMCSIICAAQCGSQEQNGAVSTGTMASAMEEWNIHFN